MAKVEWSAGIDSVSGALAKPGKNPQHRCTKMLLAKTNRAQYTGDRRRIGGTRTVRSSRSCRSCSCERPHEDGCRQSCFHRTERPPGRQTYHEVVFVESLR